MLELRPLFVDPDEFVARVERQQLAGYHLAFLEAAGEVRSVAGYRVLESLSAGKFLYVDDLVTCAVDASRGYGGMIYDWLIDRAREMNCVQFHLDSGVWRHGAHRFYLRKGMDISSHHFAMPLAAHRPEAARPA